MKLTIHNPSGHYQINGRVTLQGAKNSMLNNLLLPLLTDEECVFENVPRIDDVLTNLKYLERLGADVAWLDDTTVKIHCRQINYQHLDADTAFKTTGSKYFIPFMVHKFGEFKTGPSGGDQLGSRSFLDYAESLASFGIEYEALDDNLFRFYSGGQPPQLVHDLKFPSLGLTINAIFAAVNCGYDVSITNTCQEAEIDNTIAIINEMGGDVQRQQPDKIVVKNKAGYKGGRFRNMSDRNVAVSYAMLAVTTGGKIEIGNFDDAKMQAFYRFLDAAGCKYTLSNKTLLIDASETSREPHSVKAYMYPDMHSDWQPVIAPFLTQLDGTSYIEEHLFPHRLGYWQELAKMGAVYKYDMNNPARFPNDANPHAVSVSGPVKLHGSSVRALDLRAGMGLVLAALISEGTTVIENAEQIYRGYEKIDGVLKSLGVQVELS